MKKIRWKRLILLLIILIIIAAAINYGVRWFSSNHGNLPQGQEIKVPEAPLTPQNMSDKQKQDVIDQAQRDAIEAAIAAGQSDSEAQKFGELAKKTAQKAMSRPSTVIAD